jgi:hypothetical protein
LRGGATPPTLKTFVERANEITGLEKGSDSLMGYYNAVKGTGNEEQYVSLVARYLVLSEGQSGNESRDLKEFKRKFKPLKHKPKNIKGKLKNMLNRDGRFIEEVVRPYINEEEKEEESQG